MAWKEKRGILNQDTEEGETKEGGIGGGAGVPEILSEVLVDGM